MPVLKGIDVTNVESSPANETKKPGTGLFSSLFAMLCSSKQFVPKESNENKSNVNEKPKDQPITTQSKFRSSTVDHCMSFHFLILHFDGSVGLHSVSESQGVSKDMCRSMVAMLDADQSGKLGFKEFEMLMNDITKWKAVFKLYDVDQSGKLSAFELREALNSAGYKLNNRILNALAHRYSNHDGMITVDDFIMCAIKIRTMMGNSYFRFCFLFSENPHILFLLTDLFTERDIDHKNMVTFTLEEWMAKTLYS